VNRVQLKIGEEIVKITRPALRLLLLLATALIIPACGSKGPPGVPGPGAGAGITFDNSISGMAATNVQDAIDELDFRLDLLEQVPTDSVHTETVPPFSYTVPPGQSLVVTFMRSTSSSPFLISGVLAGYDPVGPLEDHRQQW